MRKQILGLLGAASIASTAFVAAAPVAGAAAPAASAGQVSAQAGRIGGKISRNEVIQRAAYWYKHRAGIRYNWQGSYRDPDGQHRYRTDCSGYVSMALHLKTSASTVTLPGYGVKIGRKSMKKGDFTGILGAGTGGAAGHVRIFEKWANKAHTAYWAYDFGSTPVKHKVYYFSTDKPRNGHGWSAYRYKKVY
ncbi:hypothetical protein [Actinoallomurus soli]|uniref:hypothetical protein n=1 Tax=Actinoallomurus soli TaxID=2952535 RepID=UPI002092926F|nr:hypothetical protein [Actinoallomurus soli]MCO5968747.1 hypothetical protein [Actinoallomurus soli]